MRAWGRTGQVEIVDGHAQGEPPWFSVWINRQLRAGYVAMTSDSKWVGEACAGPHQAPSDPPPPPRDSFDGAVLGVLYVAAPALAEREEALAQEATP